MDFAILGLIDGPKSVAHLVDQYPGNTSSCFRQMVSFFLREWVLRQNRSCKRLGTGANNKALYRK